MRLRVCHKQSQFGLTLARFMDYCSSFWGPRAISTIDEPRGAFVYRSSIVLGLSEFWPVSWTITHLFGVPKRFPWLSNPKARLHVGHQQSQFGLILARFLEYYSPFWGPKAISMVVEPQGVLTFWSSRLIVWDDSGQFLGLLLSFGVPK